MQNAWFPIDVVKLNQLAYGGYSHSQQNAIDCVGKTTKAYAFAPYDGKVVAVDEGWGAIWYESTNKVLYADGTFDYMTMLILHSSSDLKELKGQSYSQGEKFCKVGNVGPSGTAIHFHIEIIKGAKNKVNHTTKWKYRGNIYAHDGFHINTKKTDVDFKNNRWMGTKNKWKYITN